mmetsp:Transcript_29984/g.41193  ORF Transcript_29984/g.41193 Transcript_29984/m.41193 type:complete len:172 (+) Transcript_29984:252-767(+)|eukprot:CAMPEP_0201094164 /NCGR_PEP_ID=MMETSP0812-20130820/2551_1 /ASSEMBLY_ACC=CAM_ASM_000668 /TAXON_ID=98059 /ORGANISM="Dinobryon sp., Strain UTEXLB2267" /LENGTH=171 /DNA_ID=CAMNT_0047346639 /DNA_START=249 /DNA_END=764 /DNA_ORIENTATION=-
MLSTSLQKFKGLSVAFPSKTLSLNLARAAPQLQFRTSSTESYTEKQAKKGRPVSPHVTVYRFPVAAITSITNRVTGVLLTVGITGIGGLALVGADISSLLPILGSHFLLGPVAKFGVSFPLVYHYLGGVRHLLWDQMPDSLLTNESVTQSSYLLAGSSLAISGALALVGGF